jgi:hypothetical protein
MLRRKDTTLEPANGALIPLSTALLSADEALAAIPHPVPDQTTFPVGLLSSMSACLTKT